MSNNDRSLVRPTQVQHPKMFKFKSLNSKIRSRKSPLHLLLFQKKILFLAKISHSIIRFPFCLERRNRLFRKIVHFFRLFSSYFKGNPPGPPPPPSSPPATTNSAGHIPLPRISETSKRDPKKERRTNFLFISSSGSKDCVVAEGRGRRSARKKWLRKNHLRFSYETSRNRGAGSIKCKLPLGLTAKPVQFDCRRRRRCEVINFVFRRDPRKDLLRGEGISQVGRDSEGCFLF